MTRIDDIATAVLKKHGNDPGKALRDFNALLKGAKLDLALEFLRAKAGGVSPTMEFLKPTDAVSDSRQPPATKIGSIKVKEHDVRQHRRRTHAEKEAAMQAMMASAEAVFELSINGRAIGGIAIGELPELKRVLIDDASHKLMLGTEQARNAVLAELIEQHCTVQDQLTRVRDAVSAKTLAQLVQQAEQEAPRRISVAMRAAADAIEHRREITA